jgi:hypothetical protein
LVARNGDVDIHVKQDEAFKLACENDNLSIVQWLYSLGGISLEVLRSCKKVDSPNNPLVQFG